LRAGDLEEERVELKERLRAVEKEERKRWRRREGQDRRVARLEREIERREAEIERLQDLLEGRESEIEAYEGEFQDTLSRKDVALEDALRRVEGLQHDLEERENEVVELRATIDKFRAELDLEYELRRRMADPANRLREGIDLFNGSEHLQTVNSISKSLGQPKVHVALERGDESPVILTFVWEDITWRTYRANPDLAIREPRVYLESTGEGPTNMDSRPSNAHIGSNGRVVLGL
jgi:chromosome segregation ATPase